MTNRVLRQIHYNSPVILTFALACLITLIMGFVTRGLTTSLFFSVYNSSLLNPLTYVRLIGHVIGHADFAHFTGNMLFLLVIGPPMEEKYGSKTLLVGIVITAVLSGISQMLFFSGTSLLGASGIVFMLIMMSSLSGMKNGKIPLTLIIVAILYLGQEIYDAIFIADNVSQFTHIFGGLAGTVFGFYVAKHKI